MTLKEFDIQVALGTLDIFVNYEDSSFSSSGVYDDISIGDETKILKFDGEIFSSKDYLWIKYLHFGGCSTIIYAGPSENTVTIVTFEWIREKFIEEGILTND